MTKLSISKAWDETRAVLARDGSLLTTIALALFVLPGVISDTVTPAAAAGQLPKPGYWMLVAGAAVVIAVVGELAVIRVASARAAVGEASATPSARALYLAAT